MCLLTLKYYDTALKAGDQYSAVHFTKFTFYTYFVYVFINLIVEAHRNGKGKQDWKQPSKRIKKKDSDKSFAYIKTSSQILTINKKVKYIKDLLFLKGASEINLKNNPQRKQKMTGW